MIDTLGAIFVNFHDHVRPIIDDARKDDMGKENLEIYENYLALFGNLGLHKGTTHAG